MNYSRRAWPLAILEIGGDWISGSLAEMGRSSRRDTAAITIMLRLMSMSHLFEVSCQGGGLLGYCVKVNPRRDASVESEELQIPSLKRGTCVEACALRNVLGRTCPGFKIGGNAREDTHEKFNRL